MASKLKAICKGLNSNDEGERRAALEALKKRARKRGDAPKRSSLIGWLAGGAALAALLYSNRESVDDFSLGAQEKKKTWMEEMVEMSERARSSR